MATKNTAATQQQNQAQLYYTAGLDIGNGYVKGLIGINDAHDAVTNKRTVFNSTDTVPRDEVDMPSVATALTRTNHMAQPDDEAPAAVQAGTKSKRNTTEDARDFFNAISLTPRSTMIRDERRYLVGSRALHADGYMQDFAVTGSTASKAEQPLSKLLVLSIVAAKAVRDYVTHHGALPGPNSEVANTTGETAITAHVTAALALPITEFVAHRHAYAADFTGPDNTAPLVHTVTVNNFDTPVTVNIIFDAVQVIAEGASAQYAISQSKAGLIEHMLDDVRSREATPGDYVDPDITADDVRAATNTVGVDIGEGTVNFAVFTDGKFNTDASHTYPKGYGTIMEQALMDMESKNVRMFSSRKQLAEFLLTDPSPMKRNQYNHVKHFVDTQIDYFVDDMVRAFGQLMSTVGVATEVVYVYGGGSAPMREQLLPALIAKVQEMTSFGGFPVLYLDAQYSRNLNRQGLLLAAQTVARNSTAK